MSYRFEATTLEGFLQQLAVCYVGRGYWFYVTGFIPLDKDPTSVDRKLIERYGIDISKWTRARRKRAGMASVQYLRYRRFFVLLATQGKHRFFDDEGKSLRDVRRFPITFSGYSVSVHDGQPHVRIQREEYLRLKAYLLEIACKRSASRIAAEIKALPFQPYKPVRVQCQDLIDAINRVRKQAGLSTISRYSVRLKRRICRPFEPVIVAADVTLKTGTG